MIEPWKSFHRWEPHSSPGRPGPACRDARRAHHPLSMRPFRCTTPCPWPAYHSSAPVFPTTPSHQTPLGSVLAAVWAPGWRSACGLFGAASHLSEGPCFQTRCDAITALPQTPRSPAGSALVSRRRAHRNGAAAQLAQMPRHVRVTRSPLPRPVSLDRHIRSYPGEWAAATVYAGPLEITRHVCLRVSLAAPKTKSASFTLRRHGGYRPSGSLLSHDESLFELGRRRSQSLDAGLPTPG